MKDKKGHENFCVYIVVKKDVKYLLFVMFGGDVYNTKMTIIF